MKTTEQMSIKEFRKLEKTFKKKCKPNKYHAVKTIVDGITFDSKKEAKRYGELKFLEKTGEISRLEVHRRFKLESLHWLAKEFEYELVGYYECDFYYIDKMGNEVIEDVKSRATMTPLYRWKKKHMEIQYFPLKITEII